MNDVDHWESGSAWWQSEFTGGVDPEYEEQIIPLLIENLESADSMLDIGSGEGQLSRAAVAAGVGNVVGFDPAWAQITTAKARAGGPTYFVGEITKIPIADCIFDLVVACLVFEHIETMDEAIAEIARVTKVGGKFLLFLNHPLIQVPGSGWIDDQIIDEQYWRIGPYLSESRTLEEVAKGVFIPFSHRPLSRYLNRAIACGFEVEQIYEPPPPDGYLELAEANSAHSYIPRLMMIRFRRNVS